MTGNIFWRKPLDDMKIFFTKTFHSAKKQRKTFLLSCSFPLELLIRSSARKMYEEDEL